MILIDFLIWCEKTILDNKAQDSITLAEVASIKIICDVFFIKNFGDSINRQKK